MPVRFGSRGGHARARTSIAHGGGSVECMRHFERTRNDDVDTTSTCHVPASALPGFRDAPVHGLELPREGSE